MSIIIRQITLNTQPAQQYQLYFDSRSNAMKDAVECEGGFMRYSDDYKQEFLLKFDLIAGDCLIELGEQLRAHGEMECSKMHAQLRFDQRIEKDQMLSALVKKRRYEQTVMNAQRVQAPPNLQS